MFVCAVKYYFVIGNDTVGSFTITYIRKQILNILRHSLTGFKLMPGPVCVSKSFGHCHSLLHDTHACLQAHTQNRIYLGGGTSHFLSTHTHKTGFI